MLERVKKINILVVVAFSMVKAMFTSTVLLTTMADLSSVVFNAANVAGLAASYLALSQLKRTEVRVMIEKYSTPILLLDTLAFLIITVYTMYMMDIRFIIFMVIMPLVDNVKTVLRVGVENRLMCGDVLTTFRTSIEGAHTLGLFLGFTITVALEYLGFPITLVVALVFSVSCYAIESLMVGMWVWLSRYLKRMGVAEHTS